jgi:hypothetical protein
MLNASELHHILRVNYLSFDEIVPLQKSPETIIGNNNQKTRWVAKIIPWKSIAGGCPRSLSLSI